MGNDNKELNGFPEITGNGNARECSEHLCDDGGYEAYPEFSSDERPSSWELGDIMDLDS